VLKLRVLSASVLLTGLTGLLYADWRWAGSLPGIWLLPCAILISHLMARELLDLWRDRLDRPIAGILYAGVSLPVVLAATPLWGLLAAAPGAPGVPGGSVTWAATGVLVAIVAVFAVEMHQFTQPGQATARLGRSTLAIVYAGWLISFLVSLRLWHDARWGMAALLSVILIVKCSDTGAYFVGRALGRHWLAPVLSPKKTWEGVAGGLAAAWFAGGLCYAWVVPELVAEPGRVGPLWGWLLYATILAVAGLAGDLAESLLKRDANRKDSSTWLPGLGGVLDLADSLTLAAPAAYACWAGGLIGPR
jgi:phosphatidate cytidylyltransferase